MTRTTSEASRTGFEAVMSRGVFVVNTRLATGPLEERDPLMRRRLRENRDSTAYRMLPVDPLWPT